MFTGIIEEKGTVKNIKKSDSSAIIEIQADIITQDIHIGDSIAVNGVCLTCTEFNKKSFKADVMNETLSRSSLGSLKSGSHVNLERAMKADGRFGGHIVSGHIDGTGIITGKEKDGNAIWFSIETPPDILRLIVMKGSIAIDGISLTVAYVDQKIFKVSIIPHTLKETILDEKGNGDVVNLENDVIGKYVEKLISPNKKTDDKGFEKLLVENGFI